MTQPPDLLTESAQSHGQERGFTMVFKPGKKLNKEKKKKDFQENLTDPSHIIINASYKGTVSAHKDCNHRLEWQHKYALRYSKPVQAKATVQGDQGLLMWKIYMYSLYKIPSLAVARDGRSPK